MSADGQRWTVLNAAPDLRQQLEQTPALQPNGAIRSTPIDSVVLTGGDVDVLAGLLTLRERQRFDLYASARVLGVLDANPIFEVLSREFVGRHAVDLDQQVQLGSGVSVTLFAVPGKVPLYLEQNDAPAIEVNDQTVGAEISDGHGRFFYIPGCAAMTPALAERLRGAALVLFDGTLWSDDEMVRAGLSPKTGARMGHMSVSGPGGTMEAFRNLDVRRRILIHINNSNPVLLDNSPERAEVEAAGWEVAYDGMEIAL